jgi:glycerol-3-phosphate dehydrogenase (NAD(P)+)
MRVTEIYREELTGDGQLDHDLLVLAGPCFAKEVARNQPTAGVLASANYPAAEALQEAFSSELFRFYTIRDVTGVELCGALKNVIALASGAISGLGLGDNTRAALITRGLAEIARLATVLGGRRRTVAGLAGVGDMVLTCTSSTSRNFSVGYRLGQGETLEQITSSMKMVAEGVSTTISAVALAEREKVEMPICRAMFDILYRGLHPRDAVRSLMTRGLKHEWEPEIGE